MWKSFAWASVAVGLLSTTVAAQEKLAFKFEEGRKAVYQTESKTEQVLTIAGMDIDTKYTAFQKSTHTTGQRAADGTIRQVEKVDSLQAEFSLPGGINFQFDSTNPDKSPDNPALEPLAKLLRVAAKANSTIVYDRSNELKEVEVPQDLIGDLDPTFQPLFSPEKLKKQAENARGYLPKEAVKPGDKWEQNVEMAIDGGQTFFFRMEHQFTGVVEKDGRTLHRIVTKPLSVTYAMDPNTPSPLKVTNSDLKIADSDVEILFDAKLGQTTQNHSKLHITGPMTFSVNGMELPGKLDLTLTQKVQLQP